MYFIEQVYYINERAVSSQMTLISSPPHLFVSQRLTLTNRFIQILGRGITDMALKVNFKCEQIYACQFNPPLQFL